MLLQCSPQKEQNIKIPYYPCMNMSSIYKSIVDFSMISGKFSTSKLGTWKFKSFMDVDE